MTRTQWCREHIDKTAEECGLGPDTVMEVKKAAAFCDENPTFVDCGTKAIMALIRVKDDPVRERAISHAQNALNDTLPTGGKKKKSLTEREVKKLIERADIEVRKELMKDLPPEKKPPRPAPAPVPAVKPARCMYLTRDDHHCTAPGPLRQTCNETRRQDRNCPLTLPEEQDTIFYEGTAPGDAFAPSEPRASAVVHRTRDVQEVRMSASYEVQSGRYTEGAIRQIVQRGKAGDEDAAAQLAFETGIERLMDEIEGEIQAESEGLIEDEAEA